VPGADGITFTLQNTGYGALNSINPKFSAVFDTWLDGPGSSDTFGFVSVCSFNCGPTVPEILPFNIEDGQYHPTKFQWNPVDSSMTVTIGSYTKTMTGVDLDAVLGSTDVIFGFTGNTGWQTNEQKVCIKQVSNA
jgi:hypothetical protein